MPSSNKVRKVTSENYPTDAGREGELIFRLVYQQAGCKKSFSRLWLSSMLVDIQAKLAEGKSMGYARWAKRYNLKEMSKTLIFLQEHTSINCSSLL